MASLGEVKVIQTTIPSGAGTASGVLVGGYREAALLVPVLTSALLNFIVPNTGATFAPIANTAGTTQTIATPGGTGGVLVAGIGVPVGPSLFGGYSQEVRISAAAAQAADRTFTWFFKG